MRKSSLSRRTALKSSGRIKTKKRSKSEFARIYGSKERVEFVKSLKCCACGYSPPDGCDNAHIETGGMGRKADFTTIIPLCRTCHFALDMAVGRERFAAYYGINLEAIAANVESRWLSQSGGQPKGVTEK